MYCVWDLVFIWSKLQLKVNPSKQAFVEQCYNMLRIAANVKAIFPFMKTIREEIGEGSVQLSVELCGCALQLDLQDDPETKSLIYKTIAYLLPTDLEICRICALSVFFLDRTIQSYRIVERLYGYSDEDYNEFTSYVENRVRFELLPILKRGLLFDPEFWSFSMIQTNCIALLGDEATLALSNASAPVNVAEQQSLPLDAPVVPLQNGELKHKESSSRLRLPSTPRKNHTVPLPSRMDTNTPRHQCTLCNREFLGGHILRHAQTHLKKGWFSCVMCVRKFRNKMAMLRHLKHHLKKIQRHRARNSVDVSSDALQMYSDKTDINSSETSSETGNSNQDLLDNEHPMPGDNHTVDHNGGSLNYSTATQTSFSTDVSNSEDVTALGEMQDLDDAGGELSECVKLNGALFYKDDPVVNRQDTYPCPAEGCQRVFQKVRALNKHARRAHPSDAKVQQHIMAWNKGKCRFCQRKFLNCRHFIDHLRMHSYPNVYVCQQLNCNKRFKFSAQLSEHRQCHETFEVQCGFMNCFEVFDQISSLHEHEAQHYEQSPLPSSTSLPNVEPPETCLVPQEDSSSLDHQQDTALPPIKKVEPAEEDEALDLPVPIWKSRKDLAEPKTYKQVEKKINGEVYLPEQVLQTSCNVEPDPIPETTQAATAEEQSLNGHPTEEEPNVVVETCATVDDDTESSQNDPPTLDTAQEIPPTEVATENAQIPPKPNVIASAAYGAVAARPFSRPLPPSYLDEQYISMPKRRKNGQEHHSENHTVSKAPTDKLRCWKCLTNYCSSEALEQHLAQKKCQLYFGFDSDDESAW
ncbi:hypothetical protein GDO78_008953 [Eleutherodactylus coqui]|uniref:C2H2-type domain-containing protein n=2 Tax=Eleutherodactylus coqui TaxID=57060 RepID=A0A8J6FGE9_ELECQ|nr:hypothetical protein GDO78_008953 [Eleutherodactylus coqui]